MLAVNGLRNIRAHLLRELPKHEQIVLLVRYVFEDFR